MAQQMASYALILTVLSFSFVLSFSHYSQQRSETIVCELVVANSRAAYVNYSKLTGCHLQAKQQLRRYDNVVGR